MPDVFHGVPDVFVQCRMFSLSAGYFRSMPDVFHGVPDVFVQCRMLSFNAGCFH
jgi:hypothetical protein